MPVRSDEIVLWKALAADAALEEVLQEGRGAALDPERVAYLRGHRDALAWALGWERDRDTDVRNFLAMSEMEAAARDQNWGDA